MKKALFMTAAAVAGLSASPALAQQQAVPGGLHASAIAGFEGLEVESSDGSATATADSAVYGIAGGYDLSLGNAFVGVEGELSASDGSTSFPSSFAGARDGLEANGQYYLGVRAGVGLTDGIAAYGKVGYTSLDTKAFTSSGSLAELEDKASGIRFGGGLQVELPGPFEGRVEYRRSQYRDFEDPSFGAINTDQVVAGIGVRF